MARPRTDIAPRIVRAARARFLEHGVEGASLRAIAKDAKTSIGMVYYYYPTKDDLFLAVVEETYEQLLAGLEQALAGTEPVEVRLLRLYERVATLSNDEVEMLRLVVREALVSSARLERLLARFMRGHMPLVLGTILQGRADGTFDARRHPIVLVFATLCLAGPPQFVRRVLGERLPVPGAPAGKDLAREMFELLLHGAAAPSSAPGRALG